MYNPLLIYVQIACERDVTALQYRYKKITKAVRSYSAWEAANARATGGGLAPPPPVTDGIIVHGVLLSLRNYYGVGMTGLESFDSDSSPLLPAIDFAKGILSLIISLFAILLVFFVRFCVCSYHAELFSRFSQ